MSFDNDNLLTSAQHKIICFYRNEYERSYWELVKILDSNPKGVGMQFHHVVPNCLLKKENRKSNVDGVYCTPSQHEKLHHLLASSYLDNKSVYFKLSKCLIQWSGKSLEAKAKVIGSGPTKGTTGIKQSPEWVEKKRQSLIGRKRTSEQRERMRIAQLGIPKPNSGMRPYQLSRPWRHPKVSGNEARLEDWSKAQDVHDFLNRHPYARHCDVIKELNFNSRRTYCGIFNRILEGWIPGLDSEWVNDFVNR